MLLEFHNGKAVQPEAEGPGVAANHADDASSGTRDHRLDATGNIMDARRGAKQAIGYNAV
jgi:hypothetical protein